MKVKTRDGEVELTPEMVVRGMVFEANGGATRMTIGDGSHDEGAQRAAIGLCERLLGCDPTLASRADCERFGAYWFPPRRDLPAAASDTKKTDCGDNFAVADIQSSAAAAHEASAVTRADVTLAPCGHPVVTIADDSGAEHVFHMTEAITEGLARSIGDVLQFPWTNRESVSQRCPRHPDLRIGCGATCTQCYREAGNGTESHAELPHLVPLVPDLCLDFAIKAKDYLRTRAPALAEEARSLHARILAIMPESDARRESLDTLLRMVAEAPSRKGE